MMGLRTRLCSLAVILVGLFGCGTGGDFLNTHVNELNKDCGETLRCKSGSIEFAAATDMEDCVNQSGNKLEEAGEGVQATFLDTVQRCSQLQVCDYVSCTKSNPDVGYASLHRDLINYDCTEQVACRIMMGQQPATTAVQDCVVTASNTLNFATPQVQAALEQKGMRCAGQRGCAWANCQ